MQAEEFHRKPRTEGGKQSLLAFTLPKGGEGGRGQVNVNEEEVATTDQGRNEQTMVEWTDTTPDTTSTTPIVANEATRNLLLHQNRQF